MSVRSVRYVLRVRYFFYCHYLVNNRITVLSCQMTFLVVFRVSFGFNKHFTCGQAQVLISYLWMFGDYENFNQCRRLRNKSDSQKIDHKCVMLAHHEWGPLILKYLCNMLLVLFISSEFMFICSYITQHAYYIPLLVHLLAI